MTSFSASMPDDKINKEVDKLLLAKESIINISRKLNLKESIVKKKRFMILFVKSRNISLIQLKELYDMESNDIQLFDSIDDIQLFSKLSKQFTKLSSCVKERSSEPEPEGMI